MPNQSKTRPYHLSADRACTVLAKTARGLDMARFRDAVAFGAEWRGRAWVRLPEQPEPTREDLEMEAKDGK